MEKKRILIAAAHPIPGPSGTSQRVIDLVKGLTLEFEVDIVAVKHEEQPHLERFQGSRIFRVPLSGPTVAEQRNAFRRALQRQIESGDYQIVHAHDILPGLVAVDSAAQYGHKAILEVTALPSWEFAQRFPEYAHDRRFLDLLKDEEQHCLAGAHSVITGSEVTRKFLIQKGADRHKVFALPGGVDLVAYFAGPPRVRTVNDPFRLLFMGELAPWYGLDTVFKAIAQVRKRMDIELTLLAGGRPEWRQDVLAAIRKLGIVENVILHETVAPHEVIEHFQAADAFLMPLAESLRNMKGGPVPRALHEFLAGNRPMIAAATPAVKHVLEDEVNALLYLPGRPNELAAAMAHLAADPADAGRIARNALEFARRNFAAEGMWLRIKQLYRHLMNDELPEVETLEAMSSATIRVDMLAPDAGPMLDGQAAKAEFADEPVTMQIKAQDTGARKKARKAKRSKAKGFEPVEETADLEVTGEIRPPRGRKPTDFQPGEDTAPIGQAVEKYQQRLADLDAEGKGSIAPRFYEPPPKDPERYEEFPEVDTKAFAPPREADTSPVFKPLPAPAAAPLPPEAPLHEDTAETLVVLGPAAKPPAAAMTNPGFPVSGRAAVDEAALVRTQEFEASGIAGPEASQPAETGEIIEEAELIEDTAPEAGGNDLPYVDLSGGEDPMNQDTSAAQGGSTQRTLNPRNWAVNPEELEDSPLVNPVPKRGGRGRESPKAAPETTGAETLPSGDDGTGTTSARSKPQAGTA